MSPAKLANTRLSSIGSLVVTVLFCISVPYQDVANRLSINKCTLSSGTTQWWSPDLLPVGKPQKMDSQYWAVMVYRDSVQPRSRHFGTTTGLTFTQFWLSDVDLSPRTAGSNYTNVQIGLWHRIRLSGTFISVFVPRFVNTNLSSSPKYVEDLSTGTSTKSGSRSSSLVTWKTVEVTAT